MNNNILTSGLLERSTQVHKKGIKYGPEMLKKVAEPFLSIIANTSGLSAARERLHRSISVYHFDSCTEAKAFSEDKLIRVRDSARALLFILKERSEKLADFSMAMALFDIARDIPRPDLGEGFYAEMVHLFLGIQGKGPELLYDKTSLYTELEGREGAIKRSEILDKLWTEGVLKHMSRYSHGLNKSVQQKRIDNRKRILKKMGGNQDDWNDWRWHFKNVIRTADKLVELVSLSESEYEAIKLAKEAKLPFAITPFYVSLMDNNLDGEDNQIRAQVIPTRHYVESMIKGKSGDAEPLDFMLERDTSPIDLITRRYPTIAILKPYNTCPQICVYCQRNWEIDDALSRGAMASKGKILEAIDWLREHPTIYEVLITGGDPLSLKNEVLSWILEKVSEIPHIKRIRIGTRTLVTMPMRFTSELIEMLNSFRMPTERQISVVTHVEHSYEVTAEMAEAVEKLRSNLINVYNQNVYTFYVSRRFEAALLRGILKRVGIEPYYTFNTKGKDETKDFRVPVARLLQEQKEEARLLPGLTRTDEAVYNVPGLGKNYLRAIQHRDILSVLPDGSRVYEFHPWEKNIRGQKTYVSTDVPILDYLKRLEAHGEDISDYETIWYYY
ncbi:MAG: KamA family radical SAM protein [candidate division Zixibacteria bacterium]|nr:KamA family radical SAM protein [candidate division Zixibacteria bacterium]